MSNILKSSIGRKLIMSISGMFLVLFLTIHLIMNFSSIISREAYETVCEFMDSNILIQLMVPVLALGFVVHIIMGVILTFQNRKSRPIDYKINSKTKISWSSKNMLALGLIVLGFLVMHLSHFWAKMQLRHYIDGESENAYDLVQTLFSNWIYVVVYLIWIAALYFHISHGFWSMFQSIGATNSKWIPRLQIIAKIYSFVIATGFSIIPIYFFTKSIL